MNSRYDKITGYSNSITGKFPQMPKRLFTILTAFILMFCLASCGGNSKKSSDGNRPVITVGSEDYPPFMDLDNNGNPSGIDVDILTEAFDRIGYDIRFVTIDWENKDDLLESGTVDCVTGGFTVNGREDDYLWVGPYMSSNQVVVVNSTSDIHSLEDLKGKNIAVQAASTAENILLEHSNPNISADVQVFSYDDNSLPFAALGCNYVDALIADKPVVIRYMQDYNTVFTVLDEPVLYAGIGTAFAKDGDAELCAKLNTAISEMQKDGTVKKLVKGYLGGKDGNSGGEDLEK